MSKKSDDDTEVYGPPTGAVLPDDTSNMKIAKNDNQKALDNFEQAQTIEKALIFPGMTNEDADKSVASQDPNEKSGLM